MYFSLLAAAGLLVVARCIRCAADVVEEKLTVQPLHDGSFLLALDVSVTTGRFVPFPELMAYPGVLMDVMAPDFPKLFVKSRASHVEFTHHLGDWHSTWGCSQFPVFNTGETLWATWPHTYSEVEVYDFFETLAMGLWGITGAQLHLLTSRQSFIFDMNRVVTLEEPVSSKPKAKSLLSSFADDVFCVDNLYKWRTALPSLGQDGLLSLVNDERVWSRSPYKGVRMRMFKQKGQLTVAVQFQLVIRHKPLTKALWSIYKGATAPRKLLDATASAVEILLPEPLRGGFGGADRLVFDYLDDAQRASIDEAFAKLAAATQRGFKHSCLPPLSFKVYELESTTLNVQRRVQSSLSIIIENNQSDAKYIKFMQPLPYWLVPQISSLTFEVSRQPGESGDPGAVHFSCNGGACFKRTVSRKHLLEGYALMKSQTESLREMQPRWIMEVGMTRNRDGQISVDLSGEYGADLVGNLDEALFVFDRSEYWTEFGFSILLPAESRITCRVDLQKNQMRFSEIDYSMHRGQLIHSAVILETQEPVVEDISQPGVQLHYPGAFFSHVVLPDNTMSFNVMGGVGVIIGLLFSLVFHLGTSRPPRETRVTQSKKTD
ncbi:membrane protein, putative [Babesia bigemina]|uniref:Membrane protein, putative n=1 Tax=Babesia bigemina TaxID=5866 RepID=A0A061D7S5_BABBI|nr:membrane protein, putative [Babesia bigemina]CDR96736.1 membrane protein, putative [Babesia bigemina]|eukprot:XP_012768922.1 membrane protein, putative [Babesia bigemina]